MTARDFTPTHGHLILRQQGKKVGIWHLKDDCWYRKPFTQSITEAHRALWVAREARSKRASPSSLLLWAMLVGVWGWWLAGWVG